MAKNQQGPRQPLSQRRPKVAVGKKNAVQRPGRKAAVKPLSATAANATMTRKPKRAAKVARRVAPDAGALYDQLLVLYPNAHCELDFTTPFQLLVATILSAQCTDKRVNMVTPVLFSRYPTVESLARAKQEDVEEIIKSTGFFRNKAKSIIAMAGALADRHGGEVPSTLAELVTLPGVGRKTGNVVRSVWFNLPGLPVDTHVTRLTHRLKLTNETDAVKIELDLNAIVPPEERGALSLRLIEHGRKVCDARRPRCDLCVLNDVCPSAFKVGEWAKKPKANVTPKPKATPKAKAAPNAAAKRVRAAKPAPDASETPDVASS
jgi:endonuclease III